MLRALLVHAGEEQGALALARHLINVFERAGSIPLSPMRVVAGRI